MTAQISSNELPEPARKKKGINKYWLALLILGGLCLIVLIAFAIYLKVTAPFRAVDVLIKQGGCVEAMPLLNKFIEEKPDRALVYERRILCNMSFKSNVFSEVQGYRLAALQDANTLIKLKPKTGGYRALRDEILREMATLEVYSANTFAIYDLANQDVLKAIELGVVPSSFVYRHYARNLIEGNHCEEGLAETQKLIDQPNMQMTDFGQYYSMYLTEAYLCLGQLDKALESAHYMTCDSPVSSCKSGLLAEIYLQAGEYENALNIINSMINMQPAGGGWRYFIRALIYYRQGHKKLAAQDLELGASNIWYENGTYWYVKAKLAFDAGDSENGIAYLQRAEQTLDVTYTPLRKQIIKELKAHRAEPIELAPNLPFTLPPNP